jgi:hypothetical protein
MKDGSVGPAVGKCIVTVLMARRTELMDSNPEVILSDGRFADIEWSYAVAGYLERSSFEDDQRIR